MKILGIGVDIVENKRLKKLLKNESFLKRIYGKREIELSKKIKNKINFFAKRFAAKESFAKSLGTGIRKELNFKDIQILNDKIGKPYYLKTKKISKIIYNKYKTKMYDLFLSMKMQSETIIISSCILEMWIVCVSIHFYQPSLFF